MTEPTKERVTHSISTQALRPVSGSYDDIDCQFLLTLLPPEYTSVVDKEHLIQSGQRHYSEMISYEAPPSERYRQLFHELTSRYQRRLAREVITVAQHVISNRVCPITIVSLARAGTPFGALLCRVFRRHLKVEAEHYSISIIRDRGIDETALKYILRERNRDPRGLFFVDTWTAKGVITYELKAAISQWNKREVEQLNDELYVISDIGGTADFAATYDDYAIPSGVMNATVSGLMSRSVLNDSISPHHFHGSVYLDHLEKEDLSEWFLDQVSHHFESLLEEMSSHVEEQLDSLQNRAEEEECRLRQRQDRREASARCVERWMKQYKIRDVNHIKPGVAEATRVMLRRVPACLLLRDPDHADVAHLKLLAIEKSVPIMIDQDMPFQAASFIKALDLGDTKVEGRG